MKTITTKDLIKKLQQLDPDGNMEIFLDGWYCDCPVEEVKKYEIENTRTGKTNYWLEIC